MTEISKEWYEKLKHTPGFKQFLKNATDFCYCCDEVTIEIYGPYTVDDLYDEGLQELKEAYENLPSPIWR